MRLLSKHLIQVLIAVACTAGLAMGQSEEDPPSRVARLSYLSGSVSFQPGGVDDWAAATLNYPLTAGDRLWTEDNARAELHVGSAAVRLGPSTSFSFLALDDRTVQVSLSEGSLLVHLRNLDDGEAFEVDTPNLAVSLVRPGEYRIDARPDGDTSVTVRSGEAEATGDGTFSIYARQTARVTGTDQPTSEVFDAGSPDDWERWAAERDRREDQSASARYVSRETIGYEDLDQHGSWRTIPDYGAVWAPADVASDWAPYRYGRWAWVEPWGWTWIDDASWGFAPFHYGRWAFWESRWYWVPGQMVLRPVYAPALVAFVGGNHWSVSLSFGGGPGVAWFPLGPREVYRPGYHTSETYIRRVNVVNVTNVTNVYMNQRIPGAVTAVSRDTFVGARPVARAAVRVPVSAVASEPAVGAAAQFVPRRESMLARPAGDGAVRRPPAAAVTRTVVTRRAPPPPPASKVTTNEPVAPRQSYRVVAPRAVQQTPPVRRTERIEQPQTPAVVNTPRQPQVERRDRPPAPPAVVDTPRPQQVERPIQPTPAPQVERRERPQAPAVERPAQPTPTPRVTPAVRTERAVTPPPREVQRTEPRTEVRQAPPPKTEPKKEAPKKDRRSSENDKDKKDK